ncbi:T9SS type A sorting domain-containing protein [Flavobacterium zepuense]|uniref:T9SS type A sorting domain-containing protein n=1 Tax=Flavobacterium zepuense TaxID=2593302 RepID=A0A552V8F2_9FLAO|nr:T9SS type A sorting domain-containing protein [Flavobacterium zepuense]TRW26709.1 T9SS type A sorting domain-containing protein [Flavobacterium zepuense]
MKKLYAFYLLLFSITMYAQPNIGMPQDLYACDENENGFATFDLSWNDESALGTLNPEDYTVAYFQTNADAQANANPIPVFYSNTIAYNQTVYVRVSENENSDNFAVADFDLIVTSTFEVENIVSVGYDFTVTLSAPGLYQYTVVAAPAGAPIVLPFAQESNIFTDMPFGQYSLMIENGCVNAVTITFDHMLTAPVGESIQTLIEGQTLADVEVEGENIQWYATETGDNPLAMTTLLVNETTYYAAQSIDGTESTQRLAVTVHLVTLGVNNNQFAALRYYPNPVVNNLSISNTVAIDAIEVYNTLGQQVLTTKPNATGATINFSSFNSGIYFVKIQSGNAQKTIRVIKQ